MAVRILPITPMKVQLLLLIRGEKEMLFRSTAVRIVLVCSVFSVGIAVGTISISSTLAKNTTPNTVYVDKEQTQPRKEKIPNYPKNANGQTYGSGMEASSLETEPDLMRAYGVDGTVGYVKSKDVIGEMPKSLEEAAALMAVQGDRVIPLYDVDGKKVIGEFKLPKGTAILTTADK
jgi:hypothetical protein